MVTFSDFHKVTRTEFYKLIKLEVSSSGKAYFDAIRQDFIDESIWELVKKNCVAAVTDAASNMVSPDEGFVTFLERAVEHPIIKVKCQAHRLETVLKHAYKKCDNCPGITSFLHSAFSFYSASPKRKCDLRKYIRQHRGTNTFLPRKIVETRWVASHYLAAKVIYLNYDSLLGHFKSILTSHQFKKDKSTKNRVRWMISIMEQKHFLSSLALLLDVQHIFKGMSELYQTRGRSIIGQLNKKDDIISEIDEIKEQRGGTFMAEVLSLSTCTQNEITHPCTSLSEYESQSVSVKKGEFPLMGLENVPLPIDDIAIDKVQVKFADDLYANVELDSIVEVISDKFKPMSSYLDSYLDAVKAKVRSYFPHDRLLKIMVSLDQTIWPLHVERILSNGIVKDLWKQWPTLFGMTEEALTIESDMEKLVEWLKEHPDFWCSNHMSQPDEFWSQILKQYKLMPVNLIRVLKATLAIPISGADVERSFSVLNFLKSKLRNQMSPELLDIVMRIKMSKETWDTFDATRATEHWTSNNHRVCDHKQNTPSQSRPSQRPAQRPTPAPIVEDERCESMRLEARRVNREHDYLVNHPSSSRLVDQKPISECFFIFNKKNGKALSAYGNEVVLWTWNSEHMDHQLWFWYGQHLVSRSTQKVLEANPASEQSVSLNYYYPTLPRQKWRKTAWLATLDFEFHSNYHNYKLDVLDKLTEDGSIVGTAKPSNSVTQRWKIEEVRDYEN